MGLSLGAAHTDRKRVAAKVRGRTRAEIVTAVVRREADEARTRVRTFPPIPA